MYKEFETEQDAIRDWAKRQAQCPNCGNKLQTMALVDSDDRIYSTSKYCPDCESRNEAAYWNSKSIRAKSP